MNPTSPHLLIFKVGQIYRLTKSIKVGFDLDREVQAGREVEYIEHKFSRYDDCYVYYFKELGHGAVFEYWVHIDVPLVQIAELFSRDMVEGNTTQMPNQSSQPSRAFGPRG